MDASDFFSCKSHVHILLNSELSDAIFMKGVSNQRCCLSRRMLALALASLAIAIKANHHVKGITTGQSS